MHKNRWLLAAVGWSVITVILCLVQFSNVPKVAIPSADKYVHSIFHFLFVLFWFLHFDANSNRKMLSNLILVVVLSFFFGIAIELAQAQLTRFRRAEVADVLANTVGALTAALSISVFYVVRPQKK